MAVSVSPIKIISDLGYNPWEIENDEDYLSALKEATNEISIANPGDGRIAMLQDEVKRVRTDRKAADPKFKARKTKINVGSFLGRDAEPQKLLGPSKDQKKKAVSGGLVDTINSIAEAVGRIEDTLKDQTKLDVETNKLQKQALENAKRENQESRLEKVTGFLKKTGDKIIAPVQSIFGQIFGFIKNLILGKIFLNILKWFGNPANQGKIDSVIKFLGNNWGKLLSLYLVFGTGLGKFIRFVSKTLITGTIKLIALAARLAAAKKIKGARGVLRQVRGAKGGKLGAALNIIGTGAAVVGMGRMFQGGGDNEEEPQKFNKGGLVSEPQKFNKGGKVRGQGDRDTVPAMLTPGEFVMSKGAVQQYGVDTMESMNAAAGGTNIPVLMPNKKRKGFTGGGMSSKQQIMRQTEETGTFGEAGSSISTSQATPEQRKQLFADMGMPSMELWDGSVVPDFGKMGADSFMTGIQMVREGMVDHPDKIKQLDEFMATNPYAQPEKLQSMINRVVPGSTEQVLGDLGDSITASARMNGGGLVQGFRGGGEVMSTSENATMRGGQVVSGNMSQSSADYTIKKLELEKAKNTARQIHGFNSPEVNEIKKQLLILDGIPAEAIHTDKKGNIKVKGFSSYKGSGGAGKKKGGGFGLKRMIGGAADQLTGNLFDFDKRSGGGLIRKTAGALARPMGGLADMATGNLFDFDKRSGGGLIRKTANAVGGLFGGGENKPVSPDKVMAKEPKIKQLQIPADGLKSVNIKIASNQDIKPPVGQPSMSGPKITVIPENKSINTPMSNDSPDSGKSIPKFDVGYGSVRKMKQLGISR